MMVVVLLEIRLSNSPDTQSRTAKIVAVGNNNNNNNNVFVS